MSNALAIAAVTATLRSILLKAFNNPDIPLPPNPDVTVQPPDKAHEDQQRNHFVNLFLYQVLPNAAWRNMDIPQHVKQGETQMPPLALNLYYMLTAYSQDDNADSPTNPTSSHRLLGRAMSALYDNAVLFPGDIVSALQQSELQDQIERVRITLQPLTVEEIFRLWSGFQSQYRISVAYEVSVVLIESTKPTKTPLPVLRRGKDDRGTIVQPDSLPFPTIFSIRLEDQKPRPRRGPVATPDDPNIPQQPIALLDNNTLVISGRHLDGDNVTVLLTLQRLSQPIKIDIPAEARTSQEVKFKLPPLLGATTFPTALAFPPGLDATTFPDGLALTIFPAGFYTVAIVVTHVIHQAGLPDQIQTQTTNQLSFALAPQITTPISGGTRDNNKVSVTLSFSPEVLPWQRVTLLLGQQEFLASPHATQTGTLTFNLDNFPKGEYFVRLRVDGVDSSLVDRNANLDPTVPPTFDPKQKVKIP